MIKNHINYFCEQISFGECMQAESALTTGQVCFQLKANFLPCTVLQLLRYDLDILDQQLNKMVKSAPNFFQGAPVVLELEKMHTAGILDFAKIRAVLNQYQMVLMGIRGGNAEQMQAAASIGLPTINLGKTTPAKSNETAAAVAPSKTVLVNKPVRSGIQLYAKDGDLIVTGAVSPGAELMADHHIHVYGPLRGRAMAGLQGNTQARIFCRELDAELVSIAGYYLTKEDLQRGPKCDGIIQIFLENEQIRIEPL